MLWNALYPTNDGIEDMEHYALSSQQCTVILLPHGLVNLSNEELLKIILCGHEQLSFNSNAEILTATLEYIQAFKRFE